MTWLAILSIGTMACRFDLPAHPADDFAAATCRSQRSDTMAGLVGGVGAE